MFEGLFQPAHLLLILIIALLIFGPGKLPEIGASLGKSIREFKKAFSSEAENPSNEDKSKGTQRDDESNFKTS